MVNYIELDQFWSSAQSFQKFLPDSRIYPARPYVPIHALDIAKYKNINIYE